MPVVTRHAILVLIIRIHCVTILISVASRVSFDVFKLRGGDGLDLLHNVKIDCLSARWRRKRACIMPEVVQVDIVPKVLT